MGGWQVKDHYETALSRQQQALLNRTELIEVLAVNRY